MGWATREPPALKKTTKTVHPVESYEGTNIKKKHSN